MAECPAVNCSRRALTLAGGLVFLALSVPAAAPAQDTAAATGAGAADAAGPEPAPTGAEDAAAAEPRAREGAGPGPSPVRPARVGVDVRRLRHHKLDVNDRAVVTAVLHPFVKAEPVRLVLLRNGHVIDRRLARVYQRVAGRNAGRVKLKGPKLQKTGRYVAKAIHPATSELGPARDGTPNFRLDFPSLNGGSGDEVALFNKLLAKEGYKNAPNGNDYNSATRRAVLAFRKVNGMKRTTKASSTIFKRLAGNRGEFKPKHPGAGRHVEVDISRQVMALIDHGKAQYTYHVSTGAPATPTIRGHFRFYRRQAGYNSVGMYYSVYFIRGYATHGYRSVPNYPASHGCVRNPIPDSKFIYDWVRIGMSNYTYG